MRHGVHGEHRDIASTRRIWPALAAATLAFCGALWAGGAPAQAQSPFAVLTHHYDTGRTGWNKAETVLTPANVSTPGGFGLLRSVVLDAQVDGQPLVVPGVVIAGDPNAGAHDVVYVATEGNTIYAIDPGTGAVLLSRNFGTPVARASGCNNAYSGIGIQSTPVIDLARNAIYLIAYTAQGNAKSFTLHMLNLSTLVDMVPPVKVTAQQTLSDGTVLKFDSSVQRQRPALLEANNAIYAGFGSVCDFNGKARGWVMGWNAGTLQPLAPAASGPPAGVLINRNATSPDGVFLSSVWMSGAGLAADDSGIYFVTGNSSPTAAADDPAVNTPHSVLKLSFSSMSRLDIFTPANLAKLEADDADFGSGGIMLLPPQANGAPPLATAAGKTGKMFLMNRNNLGGYNPGGSDAVFDTQPIGRCLCIESYFESPTPTIVSSGTNKLHLWRVNTSPSINLTRIGWIGPIASGTGDDTSFMTSVSSNGTSSPIIWAALRPASLTDRTVYLNAYSGVPDKTTKAIAQLYSGAAGTWTPTHTNGNFVPVVANGRVYLAVGAQLGIFGLIP